MIDAEHAAMTLECMKTASVRRPWPTPAGNPGLYALAPTPTTPIPPTHTRTVNTVRVR